MKEKIVAYIDAQADEMVSFLSDLVNIDSGSYTKEGIDQIGFLMKGKLDALGFHTEVIQGNPQGNHVVARKFGSGSKTILLIGHMDTVFDAGTASRRPFQVQGSRAYGPGVADMKAGLVSMVYAAGALLVNQWNQYKELVLVMNSDEEIGSHASEKIFETEGKKADAAFVMEPGRADGSVVSARKGVGGFNVTVTGKAAHAGVEPQKGASAIEELAVKIQALHQLTDFSTGTTVNVGVIAGGTRANVVAETASAKVDYRVATVAEEEHVRKAVAELAESVHVPGTVTHISGGIGRPPMVKDQRVVELLAIASENAEFLGFTLKDTATGGGSDGNLVSAFGTPVLDGMGPVGGLVHSDEEYLELDTLTQRCKLLALTLLDYTS